MPDSSVPPRIPIVGIRLPPLALAPDDPAAFETSVRRAVTAEAGGFDSVWVESGVLPGEVGATGGSEASRPAPAGVVLEPYALLGALAVRTGSIRLAAFADGPDPREPSMVAKAAAAVDVISHGRMVLAFGSGPCGGATVEQLEERLRICRELLSPDGGPASFDGRHHRINGAPNLPRPVQPGGVPLVVVAGGACVLPTAALHADAVVLGGGPGEISAASATVREVCASGGRPADAVRLLWAGPAPDPGESQRSVATRLAGLVEAGVSGWVVSFPATATTAAIERAATVLRTAVEAT